MRPSDEVDRKPTRGWGRRRNFLQVRNKDLMIILLLAVICAVAATFGTAYMGVR